MKWKLLWEKDALSYWHDFLSPSPPRCLSISPKNCMRKATDSSFTNLIFIACGMGKLMAWNDSHREPVSSERLRLTGDTIYFSWQPHQVWLDEPDACMNAFDDLKVLILSLTISRGCWTPWPPFPIASFSRIVACQIPLDNTVFYNKMPPPRDSGNQETNWSVQGEEEAPRECCSTQNSCNSWPYEFLGNCCSHGINHGDDNIL